MTNDKKTPQAGQRTTIEYAGDTAIPSNGFLPFRTPVTQADETRYSDIAKQPEVKQRRSLGVLLEEAKSKADARNGQLINPEAGEAKKF